jgi:hypothetical protein
VSVVVLLGVTMMTRPESDETLKRFYARCRPPGLWGRFAIPADLAGQAEPGLARSIADCSLGIVSCVGLVVATNAPFSGSWLTFAVALPVSIVSGGWLIGRVFAKPGAADMNRANPLRNQQQSVGR